MGDFHNQDNGRPSDEDGKAVAKYHIDIDALINAYRKIKYEQSSSEAANSVRESMPELQAPWDYIYIPKSSPHSKLGDLEKLQLEMMQQILGHADMETLLNFRFVNRRGSAVTRSLRIWQTIEQHVPFVLPFLLKKTNSTARHITANNLLQKLHQTNCDGCSNPGDRTNLLSCERFCQYCEGDHRFQIFRASDAMKLWNLPHSQRKHVEKLQTITNRLLRTCDRRPPVPVGYVPGHAYSPRINLQA